MIEKQPLIDGLPFCRYSFLSNAPKSLNLGGGGLYACFYRNNLIYIGKYLGRKNSFNSGDIVTSRWLKHLGTFTMQSRNLGFSKKALSNVLEVVIDGENAELIPQEVADGFKIAKHGVLQRETGCMTTFQRFVVSMDVWRNAKYPGKVDLDDFMFAYARIKGQMSTEFARGLVSSAESYALERVHPPGNTIANRRLTELPDLSKISTFFEESLMATEPSTPLKFETNQDKLETNKTRLDEIEPEEELTLFEAAIEEAPVFAWEFIKMVQAYFIDLNNADIEFTNKPDMRVRKLFPHTRRGFRNCVRFEWQTSKKRFLMYSQLPDYKIESFGLSLDRVCQSDVLPNVTFLYEHTLQEKMHSVREAMSQAFFTFDIQGGS